MTHSEDGRECQHQRTHYSQRNGGEHVCSNCGESIIGDEQKARVRKTWKAGNPSWTCANCNNPIMQHEKQTFCPEGPAFASNSTSAQPARQSCEFHGNDSEACEKYSGRVPCEPARQVGGGDLPPLPWPEMPHGSIDYFSAAQMRSYARQASAALAPAAVVMPETLANAIAMALTAFDIDGDRGTSKLAAKQLRDGVDEFARLNRRAIPEGLLDRTLEALEGVMQNAYSRAYQVCCGRGRNECCGEPDAEWSQDDQWIMDTLHPVQRELRALLGNEGE